MSMFSPSDLGQRVTGTQLRLGGRIVYADDHYVVIADGYAQIALTLEGTASGLSPGDMAVVVAERRVDSWALAGVAWRKVYPEPSAHSEFGRRALAGRALRLRARAAAKQAVHRYFSDQDFVEVDTPAAVTNPGLDAHVSSWTATHVGDLPLYLITSPEFHMKRLLSAGLPRIYQICHCFRSEEQGPFHEPEFMMLEWYRAFADWEQTMQDTASILRTVAEAIADEATQQELEAPFERITASDAFATFGGVADALGLAEEDPDLYFSTLVELVEPALSRYPRPIFLTHYPLCQSSLAVPCPDDSRAAQRFELYFRGQELCNGSTELTDEREQRLRFEAELARRAHTGEPLYPMDERFLGALAQGLPPSSGTALGFDRLMAALLRTVDLESVVAFSHREL